MRRTKIMDKTYKAIQYKVTTHHDAVVDKEEPWNNSPAYDTFEMRYCIVSTDTGEVLGDAQGMGIKQHKRHMPLLHIKIETRVKIRNILQESDILNNGWNRTSLL
jgi:hypothetical protein